ncbi:TPA: hypothetical protein L5V32_003284 [Pseudomonas aeruginosa]|uniref:hypothetical protein n=1 Tax=Pseudomonas aeruginosa TaxID=287 RepID=UPI0029D95CB7|nr:hypothetical protein [Pseudomonas aeruginosa]HBP1653117.1 hypothetical protein [Pseudomonas aeruginosa]HCR1634152.1 hypothetical protein [Pseudomonas aeruginosa]HDQ4047837.1 hypothetical protein [Pseudomonas aeruginosa]HDQ4145348.1 hypothetical protein [Pseudomonas aeruginosa]
MSIDWSKAPDGCIGAFARIVGNQRKAFFVFSKRPSDYSSREGYEGEGEDGPYHVFSEYWEWIDKPWDGQGLPPVGTNCEYRSNDGWLQCEVVAHRNNAAVVLNHHYEADFVPPQDLRPLRTPEQITAEEREKAIEEMCFAEETLTVKQAKALFDAGYRRQEEGK